ncbi:MAG: hypothetical protein GXP55_22100 [Deltaproteobacteria bacterium]|nr:hypothetical protein [Deltaproteobacteria bacterium]
MTRRDPWNAVATFHVNLILTLSALVALSGCVEKSELTQAQRTQVASYVRHEAPTPQHPLDISFEDKILLLGYDIEPATWRPGESLRITWHWKVERALEQGWQLFTHVVDNAGQNRLNADADGAIRGIYPPGQWRAGEYIEDVQELTLPADWSSSQATLYIGFWNGPHRLRIVRGPNDGDNRARAFSIETPAAAPAAAPQPGRPAVPSLSVGRAATPPTIDGRLDDAVWTDGSAPTTAAFVNTMNGSRAEPVAHARMLWDDDNLYVGFEVNDDSLKSSFREHDDHLWEQDAAELFLDPSGRGLNYFELQVSPRGVTFDTRYDSRRNPGPIGHADWESQMRVAVVTRGAVDDDQADEGYTVEAAIPWASFATGSPAPSRPTPGTVWRANFYVMDAREGGQRAVAWSAPRVGDFHVPDRFGRLLFSDANAPAPTAGPVPAAAIGAPSMTPAPSMGAIQILPRLLEQQLRGRQRRVRQQLDSVTMRDQPQAGETVPGPDMAP